MGKRTREPIKPQNVNGTSALSTPSIRTAGACGVIIFLIAFMMLPVVGIIQVGSQAAADRYTYLPGISIFLLAGIGVVQLFAVLVHRKNMMIIGRLTLTLIFIAFGGLTLKQIKVWHDSETLWKQVIRSFPGRVHFAHNNLGVVYGKQGMHDKALEEYERQ